MWYFEHCILHEPVLSLGGLVTGIGLVVVVSDPGGKNKGNITIGGFKYLLVNIVSPI